MKRRHGFSLLETLIAGIVATVVGTALLTTAAGEARQVTVTSQRLQASLALDALRQALAAKPASYFVGTGFPRPDQTFTSSHAAVLVAHDGLVPTTAPGASESERKLAAAEAHIELERQVYFDSVDGRVLFRIRYRDAQGRARSIETAAFAQ